MYFTDIAWFGNYTTEAFCVQSSNWSFCCRLKEVAIQASYHGPTGFLGTITFRFSRLADVLTCHVKQIRQVGYPIQLSGKCAYKCRIFSDGCASLLFEDETAFFLLPEHSVH